MEYQTYYVSKNAYSIELKHKVCKDIGVDSGQQVLQIHPSAISTICRMCFIIA